MNIGGEYATDLVIVNIKTLSHDDSNSHSYSSDGIEFGGLGAMRHGPAPSPSVSATAFRHNSVNQTCNTEPILQEHVC